jgi:AraC-like DNA-binding protein
MGFACVSALLPGAPETWLALTLGPFCPLGETASIESDVFSGFKAIGQAYATPKGLSRFNDIAVLPPSAVLAIAEWTIGQIAAVLAPAKPEATPLGQNGRQEPADSRPGRKRRQAERVPYDAAVIVAALAGGRKGKAGGLIKGAMEEMISQPHARERVRCARLVAVAAAILEAAERADLDTASCWEQFPAFAARVASQSGESDLVAEAVRLLAPLRKPAESAPQPKTSLDYQELNDILIERLADGITLNEAASRLGQKPSTITRRLQRKFGLSFSDYAGRLRVEKAKELLRRTRLTVSEVAHRVGIGDPSNLAKLFQKFDGIAPGEYRRRFGSMK